MQIVTNAVKNARGYDWSSWMLGIMRSFLSGGSSAIVAGFGTILVDPTHFNLSDGFGHVLKMMGIMFTFTGLYRMAEFLNLHGAPDQLQQALAQASVASKENIVQAIKVDAAIADAKAQAPGQPAP